MRRMLASPRARDPFGGHHLRSAPAQSEQLHASRLHAARLDADTRAARDARRYLRRRRELLLCLLVSVLGVAVARSIPLVEHEQELCDCRATGARGIARGIARPAGVKHVLTGVTPLRERDAAAARGWTHTNVDGDGAVDVVIAEHGIVAETPDGRFALAEPCDATCEAVR
jgi:hypothetical protein